MLNRKINILGQDYQIKVQTAMENPKLIGANGICEFFSKEIIVDVAKPEATTFNNLDEFNKKVLRHEIIHAFLGESELRRYMEDEDLVDWIAIQFHKIEEVFKEINI